MSILVPKLDTNHPKGKITQSAWQCPSLFFPVSLNTPFIGLIAYYLFASVALVAGVFTDVSHAVVFVSNSFLETL